MFQNLNSKTDKELVEIFLNKRESKAFEVIYQRYFKDVYFFVFSRSGNRELSEDVVSETFITLISVLNSFDQSSSLKSFIIGIALNKTRQAWSQKHLYLEKEFEENEIVLIEEEFDEEKENARELLTGKLNEVLEMLPTKYKSVLVERFINNHSIKKTAEILGLSDGNVRVIQNRAIKKACKIANNLMNREGTNNEKK